MATAPEIPFDLKEMLHDCMLAVFWPRKKIIEFFASVGVPVTILSRVDGAAGAELSRHDLVMSVFSQLGTRQDRGYTIFQAMLDRMSNWTYFDPYWFDKQAKLDRNSAEAEIAKLHTTLAHRNAATQAQRKQAVQAQGKHRKTGDLSALKSAFARMFGDKMTPQARGLLFESFLKELFFREGVPMSESLRLNGEQIDGSFKFEGENYIVEAKWLDSSTSTNALYSFAYKVDGKMHGRGVFISVNGFSGEGITAVVHGKHIKTILVDGEDISFVLEGQVTLKELLDYKIRQAQTRGDVYMCAVRRATKL